MAMVVEFLLESTPILLYLINKSQLYLVMRYLAGVSCGNLHQIPKNYIQDSLRSFYPGKSIGHNLYLLSGHSDGFKIWMHPLSHHFLFELPCLVPQKAF